MEIIYTSLGTRCHNIENHNSNNMDMKNTSFANSSGNLKIVNRKPLARRSQSKIVNRKSAIVGLLFAFCLLFGGTVFAQSNVESWSNNTGIFSRYHANKWKENGLYAGLSPEQELVGNRTEHSKTFDNGDGTFSYMYIGDLHYQDVNGSWQDIEVSIEKTNNGQYKFASTKNKFKTYYSDSPTEGIMMDYEGQNLVFGKNYSFSFIDGHGNALAGQERTAANAKQDDFRTLSYKDFYPGIDYNMIQLGRGVETGFFVNNRSAVANGAKTVRVSQTVEMPDGAYIMADGHKQGKTFSASEFEIMIPGHESWIIFQPVVVYDANVDMDYIMKRAEIRHIEDNVDKDGKPVENPVDKYSYKAKYNVKMQGRTLTVSFDIPAEWLLADNRAYPVFIDPAETVLSGTTSVTSYYTFYNTYYHDSRWDVQITDDEMSSKGISNGSVISALGLLCSQTPGLTVSNARIDMNNSAWNTTTYVTSDWTQCYSASSLPEPTVSDATWNEYTFSTNHTYSSANGNLLVRLSKDGSGWSSGGGNYCVSSTTGTTATGSYSDSNNGSYPFTWTTGSNACRPAMRLTYTPPPPYEAEWIADGTVIDASNWCIGETRTVTLKVKNTGTATWYTSAGGSTSCSAANGIVAVSYKWNEDSWYDSHPNTRNEFTANVAPGEIGTVTFDVEGPRMSGSNTLRFNIIRRECGWFSQNDGTYKGTEKAVNITVTAAKLTASNKLICTGGSSNLTTNCNITGNFYEYEPYIWDWNSSSYTGSDQITNASVDKSLLTFKSTGNDPKINMYSIGSFDPTKYKYIRVRYRTTEVCTPGSVEIFFVSSTGSNTTQATTGYSRSTTLSGDKNWHIAEINMSAHGSWVANGNVTGWRLDPCSANNVRMEIDWIGLFPDPIATNASSLTVNPARTTTYSVCNYMTDKPCIHKATATVEVAANPTIAVSANTGTECINSGSQVTYTASQEFFSVRKGSFNSIATSGTAVTFSSQDDGVPANSASVPIGFSFNYYGNSYSNFYPCTNGFIKFGSSSTAYSNDLASTSIYNLLAPFWDDLDSYTTTSGWYQTTGAEPNRVLTYEQYCYAHHNYTSSTIRYQIKLYEGTNVIEFCYGPDFPANTSSDCSASIGINYRDGNTTKYISVTPTGDGTATISTSSVNNSINTTYCDYITSGTIYKFSPIHSFTYAWTKVSGTAGTASGTGKNTYKVSPTALTNSYTVRVTNSGCSATSEVLTITTKPTVTATSSTNGADVCAGSDVMLSATSNATDFAWSNGLGNESVVSAQPESSATYSVTASSATCTNSGSVSVNVKTTPTLTASPDPTTTCFTGSTAVTLSASGGTPVAAPFEYSEGFEGGSMPSGWTQSGDGTWNVNAGYGYNSIGTHSGTYNAVINHNTREYETFLITSKLDLSGVENAKLNFYYISYNWGSSDIDQLYVYYRVNEGSWTQLWYNTSDQQTWITSGNISLPNPSANYQIGFKMIDKYGHGVGLDDISITGTKYIDPTYTWSSTGTSGSASGTTYTVTPTAANNTYTVSADGCSRSMSINVLNTNNLTTADMTTDCGKKITLSASGIDGATYNWYDGNTLVQENSSSFTPTNINDGKTYSVKASKQIWGELYEDHAETFSYEGTPREFVIPEGTAALKLEVWGAQGGTNTVAGGKGGYSVGMLNNLSGLSNLYVYVGQMPTASKVGGWNGGGGMTSYGKGGGGATDISLHNYTYNTTDHYNDRLIVAGGGGGAGHNQCYGGYGGGTTGGSGTAGTYAGGGGGTQTSGGTCYTSGNAGVFGSASTNSSHDGGGGGGGWYGGGAGQGGSVDSGAGGGSGYVWTSATAQYAPSGYNVPASYYLTDAETKAGNATMPNPDGGTMTGREGNGYARITIYKRNPLTCESQPKQVRLTVNSAPVPSVADQTICPNTAAQLTVSPTADGYTYNWSSGYSGNPFTTASLSNDATYYITATKAFDKIVAAYDFDYSGEMQEVVAPSGADYAILEVWGAQGGGSQTDGHINPIGGKGGYATGKMDVSAGQHFYVVVGGKGQDGKIGPSSSVITAMGGYNGGGAGTCDGSTSENGNEEGAGGGGGATHIAKAAPSSGTDYQLYYYSSNQDDVLLVAGGGGGASWQSTGGYGGGTTGGRGVNPSGIGSGGYAGAQTGRASSGNYAAGIFGRGANGSGAGDGNGVAGGGGGWYGGGACKSTSTAGYNSAGGGSGHVNSSQFSESTILAGNKATIPNIAGTGTETGHSGNGHARIVFYKNGGGECVSQRGIVQVTVNKPSVGTLTYTANQEICPGTAIDLEVNSETSPTGTLSYKWYKNNVEMSGETGDEITTIEAGTYKVSVTATNILNDVTCPTDPGETHEIIVTYKKPSAEERSDLGIGNNSIVWTGHSNDWTATNNWMKYTASTDKYTLTSMPPTNTQNVVVGKYSCVSEENPTLNVNASADAKTLKVGPGVTISGSNTLTVAGTLTNKGTLNVPINLTGALTNTGTVNSSLTLNGTYNLTNNGTLNAPAVFNGVTTLAGSGTTTFSSATINSGKTLKTSSHNITISGDCTNNGTLTAGAGSITMTGNLANNGTFTTAGGAISMAGNLENNGTFTIGSTGAVTLRGNWVNNGTFTPTGAGAIIFAGTSMQTIGGNSETAFKNVQFNGSGITIVKAPTITGAATFANGVLTGDITFGNASTVNITGNSYVNGKVTKVMNANSTFTFPTGTATLYAPFEAKSTAASSVSVQYASGHEGMPDWWNHSGNFDAVGLSHASDRENWQVSASVSTSLSSIKLYWNAGGDHSFEEGDEALSTYLRVAAVESNGFNWQNLGQSSVDGDWDGSGSITAANPLAITAGAKAAGDGDYFVTFASTNKGNLLLPIELSSFTATCDGRSTLVEWTTASERNNDYFSLERSDDAINFTEIARVAGAGNSIEPLDYSYTDYGIHGGDNYYRLVQVDYDGTRTVSEIVVANCIESEVDEPEVQAYPNPFNGELTVVLDNFDNRSAIIEVYDMLGKLVYIEKAASPQNSYETILNLSNLPTGAYNVRVSTADFVINRQVVKN